MYRGLCKSDCDCVCLSLSRPPKPLPLTSFGSAMLARKACPSSIRSKALAPAKEAFTSASRSNLLGATDVYDKKAYESCR